MGLKPAFTLTANNRDVTSVVADRLSGLTLTTETEHQSDELALTLWNTDPHAPIQKPPIGAVLTLALGYEGDLRRMGQFVVSSLSGRGGKAQGRVMEVRARAVPYNETPGGVSGFQTQKTRSWRKGTTIGAMVQRMASDHGMTAGVSASLSGIHLQHFDQTDESDISFLQKLARQYDAVAKPAGGKLLFLSRGDAQSVSGKEIPPVSMTNTQVSHWGWSEDRHIAPGTVVALYHATSHAKTYAVSLGSGDPVRRLKRKFRTVEDARAAAQAEMGRRARGAMQLSLTLPGDPTVARRRQGVSGATIRRDLMVAERVMRVAKRAGWIDSNPVPDEMEEIKERREPCTGRSGVMAADYSPTAWAWSRAVEPVSLLVLLALADMADDIGVVWDAPYRVLTEKTGLSKGTIGRHVRALGDAGYLMHSPGGAYRLMTGGAA